MLFCVCLLHVLLNCFFLSFFNYENYSIKKIWVYSKSKIKTKVTSKQNLEHFKMINRRLFIHKFCSNSKMLLSSSWTIIIRALVFSSSPRANFSSFEYLCFLFLLIFRFILIRVKTEKQLYCHKDCALLFVLIQQNTVTFFSYSIRNYNAMTSEIRPKNNL